MKKLSLTLLCAFFSLNSFGAEFNFRCRSYNTGNTIEFKAEPLTLIYRDRLGNELDVWDNVNMMEMGDYYLLKAKDQDLVKLYQEKSEANALFVYDDSYQCQIQN